MSDTITTEYIEYAKARDERIKRAAAMIDIEAALRDGAPFRLVINTLGEERAKALLDLSTCPAGDMAAITALQAQVKAYSVIRDCLQSVIDDGRRAEQSLRDEGNQDNRERYD